MKGQLKKIAITSNNRKDKVFLGIDMNRQGYISKENLQEMCQKQHLPCDRDIIERVGIYFNIVSLQTGKAVGGIMRFAYRGNL